MQDCGSFYEGDGSARAGGCHAFAGASNSPKLFAVPLARVFTGGSAAARHHHPLAKLRAPRRSDWFVCALALELLGHWEVLAIAAVHRGPVGPALEVWVEGLGERGGERSARSGGAGREHEKEAGHLEGVSTCTARTT